MMNSEPVTTTSTLGLIASCHRPVVRTRVEEHRAVQLKADELLNLKKSAGVNRMEVQEGVIWLTETPATHDVLLRAGDEFVFSSTGPFLIQALGPARIVLT